MIALLIVGFVAAAIALVLLVYDVVLIVKIRRFDAETDRIVRELHREVARHGARRVRAVAAPPEAGLN